ncbi:protein Mak32p [Trichomonascus vanleenenianus]|uniref:Mak32p n=1 Tax=Trichomonascus vanleenenianus TaxID=2268995 RepID=UPI003ECAA23D
MGHDFPQSIKDELDNLQAGIVFRCTQDRKTTRAWNKYGDNEERDFDYLTPKLRITVDDFIDNPKLLESRSFHLICAPERCIYTVSRLESHIGRSLDAKIIWEPVPGECSPEQLDRCIDALKYVDVMSPNAKEAALFFGQPEPTEEKAIEELAAKFLGYMTKPGAVVIVRCGAKGCLLALENSFKWFPAYHSPQFSDYKVEDPTGGGNAFLGGFAAGYLPELNAAKGAVYANVAAGLTIEQIGLPNVTYNDGAEQWNGAPVLDRVAEYCRRYNMSFT